MLIKYKFSIYLFKPVISILRIITNKHRMEGTTLVGLEPSHLGSIFLRTKSIQGAEG
jgi:hypothetical protein